MHLYYSKLYLLGIESRPSNPFTPYVNIFLTWSHNNSYFFTSWAVDIIFFLILTSFSSWNIYIKKTSFKNHSISKYGIPTCEGKRPECFSHSPKKKKKKCQDNHQTFSWNTWMLKEVVLSYLILKKGSFCPLFIKNFQLAMSRSIFEDPRLTKTTSHPPIPGKKKTKQDGS